MRGKDVLKDNKDELIRVYENGMTIAGMARKFGVAKNTLYTYLKELESDGLIEYKKSEKGE